MSSEPKFRPDLYRGTAPYYDRYRPAYPEALFDDLLGRASISGRGRLLDLACGTGQITFPLAAHFADVVAVDQEAEAVRFAADKAGAGGVANVAWLAGSAETVTPDGSFELVTVGNAFHRLKRPVVAERMASWLQPGGCAALVWGDTPPQGDKPWQAALQEMYVEWMARAGTSDRVPAGWDAAMANDPHEEVLRRAGFDYLGKFEFVVEQTWTLDTLIGFAYSTSMLNRRALGRQSDEFERQLAERLGAYSSDGTFRTQASFAYELALKPRSG